MGRCGPGSWEKWARTSPLTLPDGAEPRRVLTGSGASGEELQGFACVGHGPFPPPPPSARSPGGRVKPGGLKPGYEWHLCAEEQVSLPTGHSHPPSQVVRLGQDGGAGLGSYTCLPEPSPGRGEGAGSPPLHSSGLGVTP